MRLAPILGPAPCASCGKRGAWLCGACSRAARPAGPGGRPRGVHRVVAVWAYEGGPRALVLSLKLRHLAATAQPLVAGMAAACRHERLDADCVTWVPARRRDISARGFDHAEVLARGLAEGLGLPAAPLLGRRGAQLDQSGLDRRRRLENLSGAFVAIRPVPPRVLLIDDLITTGATAAACATALRASGATEITLVAPCRA